MKIIIVDDERLGVRQFQMEAESVIGKLQGDPERQLLSSDFAVGKP